MKDLLLTIMESYSNDEISKETQDKLIDVLCESSSIMFHTKVFDNYEKKYPECKNVIKDLKEAEKELKSVKEYNRSTLGKVTRILLKIANALMSLRAIASQLVGVAAMSQADTRFKMIATIGISLLRIATSQICMCLSNVGIVAVDISNARYCISSLEKLISTEKDPETKERYITLRDKLTKSVEEAEQFLNSDKSIAATVNGAKAAKTALNNVFHKESTITEEAYKDAKLAIFEKESEGIITVEERVKLIKELDKKFK